MGNENSTLVSEDAPTQTLESRDLKSVAKLIKDGRVRRIIVMTGAGISTAAGIPDFRSPKTGLYHNLARLNLPFAEAVFEIDYFKENPEPFYVLAKELYPGKFHPTISHTFIALLAKKNLLRMLFTQNIDCLERRAGVPDKMIVEAHGSFATQRCVECKTEYPDKEMLEHVEAGIAPRCVTGCGGLVKPDIVFFGEQLPAAFSDNRSKSATADLMLILGTSLTVQPFASLPMMAMEGVPRVLFNKERVGDLGTRPDDVICLSDCDSGIRKLARELGWEEELEDMWRGIVGEEEMKKQIGQVHKPADEQHDEVARLADEVESKLDLSEEIDAGADANQAAQVDDQDEASGASQGGSTQGRKGSEDGQKEEVDATPEATTLAAGSARKGDEDLQAEPGNPASSTRTQNAGATKPEGVDWNTDVERHEPASYRTPPTVNEVESDKAGGERKHGESVL